MRVEDYNEFCDEVIRPYTEQIMSLAKIMGCENCIRVSERALSKVYVFYQRKRDEIKKNYMTPPVKALDRHKVAVCMAYAILRSRVMRVDRWRMPLPNEILMANEYLAIYTAINIIEQYKRDEIGEESGYKLIFPVTYHEVEGKNSVFIDNLCKSLFYAKKNLRSMDIFAYSAILFFVERYTDTIICFDEEREKLKKHLG